MVLLVLSAGLLYAASKLQRTMEKRWRSKIMDLLRGNTNLSVSFHGRKAVSGINAALPSDGITVLIGRSGSGRRLLRA